MGVAGGVWLLPALAPVSGSFLWSVLWGASWSVCLVFLRPRRSFCLPVVRWPRGRGRPWACRFALRRARCLVWLPWCVSRPRLSPRRSLAPGRVACRWPVAVAWCAPFPLLLALRPRGWFLFRSRRRLCLFAGVAPRAAWPLWSRPVARWRLSGGAVSAPSASGRVGAAGAPVAGRQLRRLSPALAGARWRALPGGALWLAPAGGVPVPPRPAVRPAACSRWSFGRLCCCPLPASRRCCCQLGLPGCPLLLVRIMPRSTRAGFFRRVFSLR